MKSITEGNTFSSILMSGNTGNIFCDSEIAKREGPKLIAY